MRHANNAKSLFDDTRVTLGAHHAIGGKLMDAAKVPAALEYEAGTNVSQFLRTVATYKGTTFPAAVAEVQSMNPPLNSLVSMYDAGRQDHILCQSSGCKADNVYYQVLRVEAIAVDASTPNACKLNDYWNGMSNSSCDNWVTPASPAPAGYSDANFGDGYVVCKETAGMVPLDLYFSAAANDHALVGTDDSRAELEAAGYTHMGTVAWAAPAPTTNLKAGDIALVQADRWAYAWALLQNSFV